MPNQAQKIQQQQKGSEVTRSAWFNLQTPAKVKRYSRIYAGNKDQQDMTALMHAAVSNNVKNIQLLLEYESKTHTTSNKTALMFAVENNNSEAVDALLCQAGIRTRIATPQYQANTTALVIAMQNQNLVLFNKLLPYEKDSASLCQMHIDAYTFILHHDIDKFFNTHFTPDLLLRNPLHYAVMIPENSDLYRQFITTLQVNQDMKLYSPYDIYGLAPIHYAILYNNLPAVQQLLKSQGLLQTNKMYRTFKSGCTPIMMAAMLEEWDIVQLLQQYNDSIINQQQVTQRSQIQQSINQTDLQQIKQSQIQQKLEEDKLNQALQRSSVYCSQSLPQQEQSPNRVVTIQAPLQDSSIISRVDQTQRELAATAMEMELNNTKLNGEIQQLQQKIESQNKIINIMETSLQNTRQDRDDQKQQNKQLQEQLKQVDQLKQQIINLQNQMQDKQQQIGQLQIQLQAAQNKEDRENSLQMLVNELQYKNNQLSEENEKILHQLDLINNQKQIDNQSLQAQKQEYQLQQQLFNEQIVRLQTQIEQKEKEKEQQINAIVQEMQKQNNQAIEKTLNTSQIEIQRLLQQIQQKDQRIEDLQQQIQQQTKQIKQQQNDNDQQLKQLNQQLEQTAQQNRLLTSQQQQYDKQFEEDSKNYNNTIENLKQSVTKYGEQNIKLQNDLKEKEQIIQQLQKKQVYEIEKLMQQIQQLQIQNNELQQQVQSQTNNNNDKQIEEYKQKILELEDIVEEKETEIENYRLQIQDENDTEEKETQINNLMNEVYTLQNEKDLIQAQLQSEIKTKNQILDELTLQHLKFKELQELVQKQQQQSQ